MFFPKNLANKYPNPILPPQIFKEIKPILLQLSRKKITFFTNHFFFFKNNQQKNYLQII